MEGKKKSIIEETLADFALIENQFNANTTEILRSISKEEITSTLNESLMEDDFDDEYEISDVESEDGDVDALPVDTEMGGDELPVGPEMGGDELGLDSAEGGLDLEAGEDSEDYEMDMTGASDEDVISVYKKLSGEDEIEVVSPNEVIITDPVSGAEYDVKLGGGSPSMIDQGEMNLDGELEGEPELDVEPVADVEPEVADEEPAVADEEPEVADEEPEVADDEESEEESEDDEELAEEGVVYEVELVEDTAIGKTADGKPRTATSDIVKGGGTMPSGDIEGQGAEKDSDSGDNLQGGFDDKGQNGTGDNHAEHIMEEELDEDALADYRAKKERQKGISDERNKYNDYVQAKEKEKEKEAVIDEEDVAEGEEAIDEKIASGVGMSIGKHRNQSGPGSIGAPDGPGAKLESVVKKYNALLSEAKKIKEENEMFRKSLKGFRKMLGETAVFNSNLTYVTKLFLEHSTSVEEKQNILERFDNEVGTIEESKKLYTSILSELKAKKPISESVENKITSKQSSSQSVQLNEHTAYVDPAQKRVLDLINRTKLR